MFLAPPAATWEYCFTKPDVVLCPICKAKRKHQGEICSRYFMICHSSPPTGTNMQTGFPSMCNRHAPGKACQRIDEREKTSEWLPLKALSQQTGLHRDGLLCLVLCGLVEEDARFADLFSVLQQPSGHRRPTLGFLQAVLGSREINPSEAWDLCRPLQECGMLQAINRDAPRSEWMLRVPSLLWSALRGKQLIEPFPHSCYHDP